MKKMKNKIISIIVLLIFLLLFIPSNTAVSEGLPVNQNIPISADETLVSDDNTYENKNEVTETVPNDVANNVESQQNIQLPAIPHKQPISKRKLVKKFLIAMLAVAGSSIFLYFGLTVYNQIRDGIVQPEFKITDKETSLKTPETLEEAVKTFLEKTKWE